MNPWLVIPAADYEGHMGPEGADQLAALGAIFAEVYAAAGHPASLAMLGCATGNGLGAIDPTRTRRIVGVDINPGYLAIARQRYGGLGEALDLRCADLETCDLDGGGFDLIHAALVFEHVDHAALAERIARWLAPAGTCAVVLQVDAGSERAPPVSRTRFASVQALASSMRMLAPEDCRRLLARHGLEPQRTWQVPLSGGKAFHVALYRFG